MSVGTAGIPPCPGTTKLSRGECGSCGTRPLRDPLRGPSGLHRVRFCEVAASQSPAPFVAATAWRPGGFTKITLCKVPSLGTVAQLSAFPGRFRALHATSWLPCGCCGTVALVRRFAQCSGQWPAASHVVCAPPTLGPRRCAALAPRGLPVRPQGAPSVRAAAQMLPFPHS